MQDCKKICIVPDDLFSLMPWDTLIDENLNYIIEKYQIQCFSSATVYKHLVSKPIIEHEKQILGLGIKNYENLNSYSAVSKNIELDTISHIREVAKNTTVTKETYNSLGIQKWQNLTHAQEEVQKINSKYLGSSDLILGSDLTPPVLLKKSKEGALRQYAIIHFAAHALTLPQIPHLSALVLQGETNPYLRLSDIETLDLNNELTFLSACETSIGKLYGGEETKSLTNSFIIAGSRSVIATLWIIHDESSMLFVLAFYSLLKSYTVSEALAITKRKCISGELGQELKKAIYWSAFIQWGRTNTNFNLNNYYVDTFICPRYLQEGQEIRS